MAVAVADGPITITEDAVLAEHADLFADGGLGLDVLVVAARNPTTRSASSHARGRSGDGGRAWPGRCNPSLSARNSLGAHGAVDYEQ
jgi:hypothetical protein